MSNQRVSLACCLLLLSLILGCKEVSPPAPLKTQPVEEFEPIRSDPWVAIESKTEVATVYRGGRIVAAFDKLAFGAAGVREKMKRGDDVTPRGLFTVTHISYQSKYGIFVGLNYPRIEDAERGLAAGIVSRTVYDRIIAAHRDGRDPPQDTPLGGLIGIHGVGRGSLGIHHLANWTAGCVAMDNNQIRKFAALVRRGVQVEIR